MGDRRLANVGLTVPEQAVLVAGTTSMGLEILAGRIIAPQFGSSIYTWGSIIGVFLAALSLGYHRGGRLAATRASRPRMATLLLGAALYVGMLLAFSQLLLRATNSLPLPPRYAPLAPVIVLFAPPVYFLGLITPYAAELTSERGTGRASGRVFAVGTAGSIFGAFATTFVLIPWFGITPIALLFGLVLVAGAVRVGAPAMRAWSLARYLIVFLVLVAAASTGSVGIAVPGQVIHETQTPYQSLQVVDRGDIRTMYLDGHPHSAMDLSAPDRHVFRYTEFFHLPLAFDTDIDRVLFIGGGGFTGPKHFAAMPGVTVDVAEIDPGVTRAAKDYFGVTESPELTIWTRDGRRFLDQTSTEYDLIVLDAYKKDKVPFQLTTVEFMGLVADRLAADGILIANVISAPSGPGSEFYRAQYKTIAAVFDTVYSFPTSDSRFVQNIEVIATNMKDAPTVGTLRDRVRERDIGANLTGDLARYRPTVQTDDVPMLRDEKAPVARLLDPLLGQRYIIEEVEPENVTTAA